MPKSFKNIFSPADMLVPKEKYRERFAVVACDQYTSEPEYWDEVERIVEGAPSAYSMIVPECRLERSDIEGIIEKTGRAMREYLTSNIFDTYENCYIYVERALKDGGVRRGLCGRIDLLTYDYNRGSSSPVRASEATVIERIPPRVKVREGAPIECPHIMVLIDDPGDLVISAAKAAAKGIADGYDFPLMQGGGHIAGKVILGEALAPVNAALNALFNEEKFKADYDTTLPPMFIAVGDGNHSLATAKECYRRLCEKYGEREMENHPARYALVELVNLHDPALLFEPIHRIVTGIDREELLAAIALELRGSGGQSVSLVLDGKISPITLLDGGSKMAVGTLQAFLDSYLNSHPGQCDYIHGEDVVLRLSEDKNSVGFLLPPVDKASLFPTVFCEGALTRKTFSMGHAYDKRYYLECRKIII